MAVESASPSQLNPHWCQQVVSYMLKLKEAARLITYHQQLHGCSEYDF